MKIAITGHRPNKLNNDYNLTSPLILAIKQRIVNFIRGGMMHNELMGIVLTPTLINSCTGRYYCNYSYSKYLLIMKLLTITMLLVLLALAVSAQTKVTKDNKGNYHQAVFTDTITNKTYTDIKNNTYPVFKNKSGKLYIWKTNKEGRKYRSYIQVVTSI